MKKNIFILLIILLVSNVYTQDTSIVKYFPLKVGNVWVYQGSAYGSMCGLTLKREVMITNTVILNSKKYFVVKDTSIISGGGSCYIFGSISFDTVRVDSINGNIYKYSTSGCGYSPYEVMVDSLKARIHDTIKINCSTDTSYTCSDTASRSIFGQTLKSIYHVADNFESWWGRIFIKGIGQSYYVGQTTNSWFTCNLVGCVVDGTLYGDTSFYTGIRPVSNQLPETFSLYQNYPNPFNPTTKIKFEAPLSPPEGRMQMVSLVIYDLLGKEIALLFSSPWGRIGGATYEVEWDASNFPSGVYFYRLITDNFTLTKKMMLVK